MKKKAMSLVLVLGLMLSLFMAAMVGTASATVPINMNFNYEYTFPHDANMRVGTTYHASGLCILDTMTAYLMRQVYWFTNGGGAGCSTMDVINSQSWQLTGYYDQDFTSEFYDTLDLSGLNYQDSGAPDQWLGVHWVVGYYIQYKLYTSSGVIQAQTGTHYVSCNEIASATSWSASGSPLSGAAAVYQVDGLEGYEDNYEAAAYGYYAGDQACLSGDIMCWDMHDINNWGIDNYDAAQNLWVKCHDWNGQPASIMVYVNANEQYTMQYDYNSGWYYPDGYGITYMGGTYVSWLSSTWVNFGEIPSSAYTFGEEVQWIIVMRTEGGSGIVWVDAVEAVAANGQPA